MLVYISIAYCIVYFMAQFACVLSNRRVKRIDFCWMLIFLAALIFIGYYLEPSKSDDLYRHYGVVNWYRADQKEISIEKNILPLSGTEQLYVYQLTCWFISLQERNAYLQVLYLGIDFFCIFKIITSFASRVKLEKKVMALYILSYFTLIPYFCSYSGLRFSAVCHMMGLGFYKYYYEKDSLIKLILLYLVSLLIHPAAGIYLMIQTWYECTKNNRFAFLLIVMWGIIAKYLAIFLQHIPVRQIQYAGEKLFYYFNIYDAGIDIRKTLAQIIFLIFIIFILITYAIRKQMNAYSLFRICIIIALLGLGSMNVMFLDRMVTMIGPILVIYLYYILKKWHYKFILYTVLGIWIISMNIYYTITIFTYLKLVI